jgi:hypothetical protein
MPMPTLIQIAEAAPPATAKRPSRIAEYDALEPALRVLVTRKNFSVRRAIAWLEDEGHIPRETDARLRATRYRSLCYRINGRPSRSATEKRRPAK